MKFFNETQFNVLEIALGSKLRATEFDALFQALKTIPASELTLANNKILVGQSNGKAAAETMSGDATIAASGALTVGTTAVTGKVLTGFSAGAGTVAGTDTILQGINKLAGNTTQLLNGTPTPAPETVSAAGAISTTLMESNLANATGGDFAVTLAAPSNQDGQQKILKMTVRTSNNITLAMTNIAMSGGYTPAGTTTLTFGAVGQSAVLMAVGTKWVYLGGTAVAS